MLIWNRTIVNKIKVISTLIKSEANAVRNAYNVDKLQIK